MSEETENQTQTKRPMLIVKLAEAARAVGYIQKGSVNKEQNYKFASVDDMMPRINMEIHGRGIAFVDSWKIDKEETRTTRSGTPMYYIRVKLTRRIVDGETGESVVSDIHGDGLDTGDKALKKAHTAAIKEFWKTTLSMQFGEDPDAESVELKKEEKKTGRTIEDVRQAARAEKKQAIDLREQLPDGLNHDLVVSAVRLLGELDAAQNEADLEIWFENNKTVLAIFRSENTRAHELLQEGYSLTRARLGIGTKNRKKETVKNATGQA